MLRKTALMLAMPALITVAAPALAQEAQSQAATTTVVVKAPDDQGLNTLRSLIAELQTGQIDPSSLEPMPRVALEQKLDQIRLRMQDLGELKSVTFAGRQHGGNVYDLRFAEGNSTWVLWLTPNGKIAHIRWGFS